MEPPTLLGAPYYAPACKRGDWLDDEIQGRTQVWAWSDAPLSWPRRKHAGLPVLILTSELARAVRTESVEAVSYWWAVSRTKVWMWRSALGVGRFTDGTAKLALARNIPVPPEASARGRAIIATPQVRSKIAAAKRGKPVPEATRKGLLAAAKRPKSAEWSVRANAWMLEGKAKKLCERASEPSKSSDAALKPRQSKQK